MILYTLKEHIITPTLETFNINTYGINKLP
jgi:hypothetical protein